MGAALLLRSPGATGLRGAPAQLVRGPDVPLSGTGPPPSPPGTYNVLWTIRSASGVPVPTITAADHLISQFSLGAAPSTIVATLTVTDPATGFVSSDDAVIRGVGSATGTGPGWVRGAQTAEAPANAATVELELVVKDVPGSGEVHLFDRLGLFTGHVPANQWSPGGVGNASQVITLEHRLVPEGEQEGDPITFEPIRHALRRAPDTSGAVEEWDGEVPSRQQIEYRATTSLPGTGGIPISLTASSEVVRVSLPLEQWFLGDVNNPDHIVKVRAQSFRYRRKHAGEVIEMPGQAFPAFRKVGPQPRSARAGDMGLWVVQGYERGPLDELLDSATYMTLRDATGDLFIYVAVLEDEDWQRLRAPDAENPELVGDYYEAGIPFVEVERPPVLA